MSIVSTKTTEASHGTHGTLRLRPSPVQPSPATSGFPITTDLESSPFHDVQTGPTRVVLPTFSSLEEERIYRKEHLALVFRILHRFKLAEGIAGHCSVRDPMEPDTFWVNPQGKSFALMKQSDLVRCSVEDGRMVEGIAPTDASASSIHSQLYKSLGRGPEGVEALVHVHGPYTKAFSSLGRTLDMISQDACAYHNEQVLVSFGGAVFDNKEGERIAQAAGAKNKVVLLQNHGALSLGRLSIDEAAWWQINYEMCCQAQLLADAARRPDDKVVEAGPDEIQSTKGRWAHRKWDGSHWPPISRRKSIIRADDINCNEPLDFSDFLLEGSS